MKLTALHMHSFGDSPVQGTISFNSPAGEVKLTLSEEQCLKIFDVCIDSIIEQTREAARTLSAAVTLAAQARLPQVQRAPLVDKADE